MKVKIIPLITILFFLVSCDPMGFGFKKNPAYVLNEAFLAIKNLDHQSFQEVTGKEAFCIYGNPEGMLYLKERINFEADDVKMEPVKLSSTHHDKPKFVGFWSYLTERYRVEVRLKDKPSIAMNVFIECDHGTEGEKNDKYLKLTAKKYKAKECRLIKLEPVSFKSLPLTTQCEILKVNL